MRRCSIEMALTIIKKIAIFHRTGKGAVCNITC